MVVDQLAGSVPIEPGLRVPTQVRPRYGETDQMGVVYHVKYFEYMELGRTEFMRAIGYPYRRMEEEGHFFVVVEMSAKLHAPARYDDLLTIWTCVERMRPSSLVFGYEVRLAHPAESEVAQRESQTLLASGTTRLASLNAQSRKVQPIPEHFAEVIQRCLPGE